MDEKTYDGTTAATVSGDVTFGGLDSGVPLKRDTDYTVAGQNNTNVGADKLTITLKRNYASICEASFNIIKAEITSVSFKDKNISYDGKAHSITLPKGTSVT